MSYNCRHKQIEKLTFGMKTNFGMGKSVVVFKLENFRNIFRLILAWKEQ